MSDLSNEILKEMREEIKVQGKEQARQGAVLDGVDAQVKKTNGRVTKNEKELEKTKQQFEKIKVAISNIEVEHKTVINQPSKLTIKGIIDWDKMWRNVIQISLIVSGIGIALSTGMEYITKLI